MSRLVGNPKDQLAQVMAHMKNSSSTAIDYI